MTMPLTMRCRNGGIALLFESPRLVAAVAELGSLGVERLANRKLNRLGLSQEFRERLPVMCLPSRRESFRGALGKAGMVKDDLGSRALLDELELRDRVSTWIPVAHSPGLDDSRVRHKLDVPSQDDAAEERERASYLTADFSRRLL